MAKTQKIVVDIVPNKRGSPGGKGSYQVSVRYNGKLITRDYMGDPYPANAEDGDTFTVTLNLKFPDTGAKERDG